MLHASQTNVLAEQNSIMNLSMAILNILHKSELEMTKFRKPVLNFFAYSNDSHHLQYFKDLIDVTLKDFTLNISVRVGLNLPIYTDRERHDAVLFVDSIDAMNFIYEEFRQFHLKGNFFYLIILNTFNDHFYEELVGILEINWFIGNPQFSVMVHALWNSILLYTMDPYNDYHCEDIAPVLLNRFDGQKWQYQLDSFFPLKIGNLHECQLTCATWEDMPYLQINENGLIGIEGDLLEYIQKGLNFKLNIRLMNDEEIAETVTDENSVLHKFFLNHVDFSIGAFPYKPTTKNDVFAVTQTYYLSDLYLFVNANREPYQPLAKLLLPFSNEIWVLLLIIYLLGALISIIVLKRKYFVRSLVIGSQNRTPLYNMFIIGLGGGIMPSPRRNFSRFLLLMWLFLALVLRNSYQGYLFNFIRKDVAKPPPNTIEEVLNQNYKIYMTESVYDAVKGLPEIQTVARFLNGSAMDNFYRLSTSSKKVAILTQLEYYNYYCQLQKTKPNIHLVKEKVLQLQLSIYMRKNSIMLRRFNIQIKNYLFFGLNERYQRKLQRHNLGNETSDAIKMKLNHLKGAFGLLFFGNIISGLSFVIEKIIFKIKK